MVNIKINDDIFDPPRGHNNLSISVDQHEFLNNKRGKERIINIWQEYKDNKTEEDFLTLYIHIPYCSQKCKYCEYFSKVVDEISDDRIDYLEEQFKEVSPHFATEKIKALNFGGGTPNLLSPKQLDRILTMIDKYWNLEISDDNEMGFEFNPYYLTDEHINVLEKSYINRLSMGIQSFDEDVLLKENRLYTSPERVFYIYNKVKKFTKFVNVDLLAGLIGQTSDILKRDVQTLLDIGVEAITIYEVIKMPGHDVEENNIEYITSMLMDINKIYDNYPNYTYVGTNPIDGFSHCNRFYKNGNYNFKYFYNPAPQGYNNVIAFSIDEDTWIYPYSFFTCIDKAYQRQNSNCFLFYPISKRSDRSFWTKTEGKRLSEAGKSEESLDAIINRLKLENPLVDVEREIEKIMNKNPDFDIKMVFNKARYSLKVGYACNQNCIHCFVSDKRNIPNLSTEEIKKEIDSIQNSTVIFTGGEPTIIPDFKELLIYAKQKILFTDLQTNAMVFDDKTYLKDIEPYLDSILIPIHSSDPKIHDDITRVPGSWKRTINALKNISETNIYIVTQTVINQLNYKTLLKTFELIQKLAPGIIMTLTFPHPIAQAETINVIPKLSDVKPYIQSVLKKYAYLMHTHYIPRCNLYPYHTIVNNIDEGDDGSIIKPGIDYINDEWQFIDYGKYDPSIKIKSNNCKNCKFDKECIGIWKSYIELYRDDINKDLIPIN